MTSILLTLLWPLVSFLAVSFCLPINHPVHTALICLTQTAGTSEEVAGDILILIQRGDELLRNKRYVEAIDQYKTAIAKAKAPVFTAYLNLGSAYYEKGDLQQASEAYRQASRIRPNDYRGYYNLAEALYGLGSYQEAETYYRKVIALNAPKLVSAQAHHFLGLSLYKQEHIDEAISEYRLSVQLNAKYAEAHYNLGIALLEHKDYQGAEQEFRITVEQDKDFVDAHFNLSVALEHQQKFKEAAEELEKYLSLNPNSNETDKVRAKIQLLKKLSKQQ